MAVLPGTKPDQANTKKESNVRLGLIYLQENGLEVKKLRACAVIRPASTSWTVPPLYLRRILGLTE